ncbi:TauD/TfdA family dioxygenase [Aquimarina sp. U1-2]|uniref:TauD/TfdA dioxygenase family protein n=1 Tax=Aquimarina sp. U1-2 TaxID=2823141 RepID=UPI001AEC7C6E|nr:TauD/TfdA family dioxygenase [Aquimarina sp. U1-2]MBP2832034.1 TauD/TfdA family dioxygenase [Aquimarina sp. U1-2]
MTVHKKKPIGAEVSHIDLQYLSAKQVDTIKMLLAECGVLIFRNQEPSDETFVNFLKMLGPLTFTAGETPVPGYPDLNVVTNAGKTGPSKSRFHIDSSYFKKPPAYSALRAVTIPSKGGDTLFTNQYWAYQTLDDHMKQQLEGKTLKHVISGVDVSAIKDAETEADHPIFRIHPISGQVSLYMSTPIRCISLSGLDDERAAPLIKACYIHSIQEKNIYRHHWKNGDIVVWDNGNTLHKADHSEVNGIRTLHRGLSIGYNV